MSVPKSKRVLVAVDNSDTADTALRNYFENFHSAGTEVILLHVMKPMTSYADTALRAALVITDEDLKKRNETRTAKWQETADRYLTLCKETHNTAVKMLIRESSSVGQTIVQVAEAEQCSAIVIGCHGHGLRHATLGSVSSHVLHHAKMPVAACR